MARGNTQSDAHLHLVRRFWNHVLTWASVIFSCLARAARSALARYFCLWKRFSSSQICMRVKEVRGFFRFGGVRFWYGWPILRGGTGGMALGRPNGTVRKRGTRNQLGAFDAGLAISTCPFISHLPFSLILIVS